MSTPIKTMLPAPKTKRGERTRQKILQAARQEIGGRGFSEASVSSITSKAGVGQGTFYIYFKSKEDVLKALVHEMGRTVRHRLSEATAEAKSRLEAERLGLVAFLDFVRDNRDLYQVVHEAQFVDPAVHRQYYTDFAQAYCDRLQAAEKHKEIRSIDIEVCAWALMGIGEFLGLRYGLWDNETPTEKIAASIFEMLENGLLKRPPQ